MRDQETMAYRDALLQLAEDLETQEREEAARMAEAARIAAEARRLEELRRCGCAELANGHWRQQRQVSPTCSQQIKALCCAHCHKHLVLAVACSSCEMWLILDVPATCCLPALAGRSSCVSSWMSWWRQPQQCRPQRQAWQWLRPALMR
jgi:hypothetical protein